MLLSGIPNMTKEEKYFIESSKTMPQHMGNVIDIAAEASWASHPLIGAFYEEPDRNKKINLIG